MTQDYSHKLHYQGLPMGLFEWSALCCAALALRSDLFSQWLDIGEVGYTLRGTEIRGCCWIKCSVNVPYNHVFKRSCNGRSWVWTWNGCCGFALPLLALCGHAPALIHQPFYSLTHKLCWNTSFFVLHDYCMTFCFLTLVYWSNQPICTYKLSSDYNCC